jgi:hypothetical protein
MTKNCRTISDDRSDNLKTTQELMPDAVPIIVAPAAAAIKSTATTAHGLNDAGRNRQQGEYEGQKHTEIHDFLHSPAPFSVACGGGERREH